MHANHPRSTSVFTLSQSVFHTPTVWLSLLPLVTHTRSAGLFKTGQTYPTVLPLRVLVHLPFVKLSHLFRSFHASKYSTHCLDTSGQLTSGTILNDGLIWTSSTPKDSEPHAAWEESNCNKLLQVRDWNERSSFGGWCQIHTIQCVHTSDQLVPTKFENKIWTVDLPRPQN